MLVRNAVGILIAATHVVGTYLDCSFSAEEPRLGPCRVTSEPVQGGGRSPEDGENTLGGPWNAVFRPASCARRGGDDTSLRGVVAVGGRYCPTRSRLGFERLGKNGARSQNRLGLGVTTGGAEKFGEGTLKWPVRVRETRSPIHVRISQARVPFCIRVHYLLISSRLVDAHQFESTDLRESHLPLAVMGARCLRPPHVAAE